MIVLFLLGVLVGAGVVALLYGAAALDRWDDERDRRAREVAQRETSSEGEKSADAGTGTVPAPLLTEGVGFPLTR